MEFHIFEGCQHFIQAWLLKNDSERAPDCILISNRRRSLLCCLDGARQEITEEDLHRIDLAYAITVHKAQGSQFKRVIVPIVRSRLLDRTLIYTALTRGMEQVVFIGDRDAFDAAVTAPPHSRGRWQAPGLDPCSLY